MNIERRKFTRYIVPESAISFYSNHSPIHGWVKDISYGGMAFEYTLMDDCEIKPEIRLILMSETFPLYLSDVSCKVIYDTKINDGEWTSEENDTRRCGVQYHRLDMETQDRLTHLLDSEVMLPEK